MTQVVYNCAPALSSNLGTLYVAVSNGSAGYLVALDSTTLAPLAHVRLKDPQSGLDALLSDNGTASPTVDAAALTAALSCAKLENVILHTTATRLHTSPHLLSLMVCSFRRFVRSAHTSKAVARIQKKRPLSGLVLPA